MKPLEIKYVYHSHTKRCGHAFGEDEEYIIAAIEKGVKTLCFTDHVPFPNMSEPGIRMEYNQLDEYVSFLNKLRDKYKDKIDIIIGLECEYFDDIDPMLHALKDRGIEFLVLGEHNYVKDGVLYWTNDHKGRTDDQMIEDYTSHCIKAMETGLFKYFAHPDIFLWGLKSFGDNVKVACRKLVECAIKHDIVIEFNVHGLINCHEAEYGYPNRYFWELVKNEYPEAKITIGLDAHSLKEYYNNPFLVRAIEITKEIGLNITEDINVHSLLNK